MRSQESRRKQRILRDRWDAKLISDPDNVGKFVSRHTLRIRKYRKAKQGFDKLFFAQGGKCGICKVIGKTLCVDHDHETGKVRGLLCIRCNSAVTLIDNGLLKEAYTYLKEVVA